MANMGCRLLVPPAGEAFVTLATTDSYCMGASVVARSLRRHGTTRSIVVMVTPNVSERSRWVWTNAGTSVRLHEMEEIYVIYELDMIYFTLGSRL